MVFSRLFRPSEVEKATCPNILDSFSCIKCFARILLPLCWRQIPADGVIIRLSGFSFDWYKYQLTVCFPSHMFFFFGILSSVATGQRTPSSFVPVLFLSRAVTLASYFELSNSQTVFPWPPQLGKTSQKGRKRFPLRLKRELNGFYC